MSAGELTPEEAATVRIIEAIKKIWQEKGEITLEGPEIVNALLEILCDLTEQQK